MSDMISLQDNNPVINTVAININNCRDTVWINGSTHLLGRFGRFLYEINDTTFGVRVYCVQAVRGKDSWDMFKNFMLKLHKVSVGDEFMPTFLEK